MYNAFTGSPICTYVQRNSLPPSNESFHFKVVFLPIKELSDIYRLNALRFHS